MRNRDTKWQFSDFHPSITKPKNYEIFLAFFSRPIIYHKLSFLSLIMLKSDRILESCSFVMMIMSMYPFFILLNINKCLIKTPKIHQLFYFSNYIQSRKLLQLLTWLDGPCESLLPMIDHLQSQLSSFTFFINFLHCTIQYQTSPASKNDAQ